MKIGIIGAGHIGSILARKFSQLGHTVKLANSRGPQTLVAVAQHSGATAVSAADAVKEVDVVVVAIPTKNIPDLPKGLFKDLPEDVVIIDTSNYYPRFRDAPIDIIDRGMPESRWVSEQIGRPVIKAFNSIGAYSLANESRPVGARERIALPVAGDDGRAKVIALGLVEGVGFDGVDGGSLDESWRQQPGTPAYCTDYDVDGVRRALRAADKARATTLRDTAMEKIAQLPEGFHPKVLVEIVRSIK